MRRIIGLLLSLLLTTISLCGFSWGGNKSEEKDKQENKDHSKEEVENSNN